MRSLSNSFLFYALYLTVALVMSSCNRKAVYSHYEHTAINGGWERTDTLHFLMPPVGKGGVFSEELGLRATSAYPFTSLTMIVSQQALPSGSFRSDTVTVALTDSDGNRLGEGFHLCQYTCQLPDVRLNEQDSLDIMICHYMKRETLIGISDIGMTIKRKE